MNVRTPVGKGGSGAGTSDKIAASTRQSKRGRRLAFEALGFGGRDLVAGYKDAGDALVPWGQVELRGRRIRETRGKHCARRQDKLLGQQTHGSIGSRIVSADSNSFKLEIHQGWELG